MRFVYLYKALAHPELNGYVNPLMLEERLMHVGEAKRTLGSEIPWIADTMTNDLKHAIGDRPNSEYLLDPDGKVLRVRAWSNPTQLRRDLEEFVGPVEKPTEVADLNMKIKPPPEHAPTGVVPRIRKRNFLVQGLSVVSKYGRRTSSNFRASARTALAGVSEHAIFLTHGLLHVWPSMHSFPVMSLTENRNLTVSLPIVSAASRCVAVESDASKLINLSASN